MYYLYIFLVLEKRCVFTDTYYVCMCVCVCACCCDTVILVPFTFLLYSTESILNFILHFINVKH